MASLLHRLGRGRVVAATVVVVTAGLLLAVTRMVFSHPAESAKEPGIVLTASPRVTSSQSSTTTATPSRSAGGVSSTQHEPGGTEAGPVTSSDSSTQSHGPQAVEPDPPVAVDHGNRQPAPAAPAAPAGTAAPAAPGRTEVDDDDDDKKPVRNGVKEADDDDRDDD